MANCLLFWTLILSWTAIGDFQSACLSQAKCESPGCRCRDAGTPGGLAEDVVPQMVIFTFDSSVNTLVYKFYDRLFAPERRNPNGCSIKMTLFVPHLNTNYKMVKSLADRGMEIGVQGVSPSAPRTYWRDINQESMVKEIQEQLANLEKQAGIPKNKIYGWRNPGLQPSGDVQFNLLQNLTFLYDSSLSITKRGLSEENVWPYTLDYGWQRQCHVRPCPLGQYQGLWEVPVVSLVDPDRKGPCGGSHLDSCIPRCKQAAVNLLWKNFLSHYQHDKAPFLLNMQALWFLRDPNLLDAVDEFMQILLTYDDVYFVSIHQALQWINYPAPKDRVSKFNAWQCSSPVPRNASLPRYLAPAVIEPPCEGLVEPIVRTMDLPKCVQTQNCIEPICRCSKSGPPKSVPSSQIPQMIIVTYDGTVTSTTTNIYRQLFDSKRKNPNGCPISMTMFIHHHETNYDLVQDWYLRGMEIGVHSVSVRSPSSYWATLSQKEMYHEIVGQRKHISSNTRIPESQIRGWRSPFLQPSGDRQFSVLYENNFDYDSTLTITKRTMDFINRWPFTMDYGWDLSCEIPPCPVMNYTGLWQVPIVSLVNATASKPCQGPYVDSCLTTGTQEAYNLLLSNFNSRYKKKRAPFMINLQVSWLMVGHNLKALQKFFDTVLANEDVHILSINRALQWMKNPTSSSAIPSFSPWQCSSEPSLLSTTTTTTTTRRPRTRRPPTARSTFKTTPRTMTTLKTTPRPTIIFAATTRRSTTTLRTTRRPITPLRTTTRRPMTPLRTTTSRPMTPLRTTTRRPMTPLRTTTRRPMTPLRITTSRPMTPLGTTTRRPMTPLRTTTRRPMTPLRTTIRRPMTPLRTTTRRPMTPLRTTTRRPLTPLRTTTRRPMTPLRTTTRRTMTPLRTTTRRPMTPLRTTTRRPMTPLRTTTRRPMTPLRTTTRRTMTPLRTTTRRTMTPLRTTTRRPTTPLRTTTRRPMTPLRTTTRRPMAPLRTTTRRTMTPMRTTTRRTMTPLRITTRRPTTPLRTTTRRTMSPLRTTTRKRPTPELISNNSTTLQGHLPFKTRITTATRPTITTTHSNRFLKSSQTTQRPFFIWNIAGKKATVSTAKMTYSPASSPVANTKTVSGDKTTPRHFRLLYTGTFPSKSTTSKSPPLKLSTDSLRMVYKPGGITTDAGYTDTDSTYSTRWRVTMEAVSPVSELPYVTNDYFPFTFYQRNEVFKEPVKPTTPISNVFPINKVSPSGKSKNNVLVINTPFNPGNQQTTERKSTFTRRPGDYKSTTKLYEHYTENNETKVTGKYKSLSTNSSSEASEKHTAHFQANTSEILRQNLTASLTTTDKIPYEHTYNKSSAAVQNDRLFPVKDNYKSKPDGKSNLQQPVELSNQSHYGQSQSVGQGNPAQRIGNNNASTFGHIHLTQLVEENNSSLPIGDGTPTKPPGEINPTQAVGQNNVSHIKGISYPSQSVRENDSSKSQTITNSNPSRPTEENNPSRPTEENNTSRPTVENNQTRPTEENNPSRPTEENNTSRPTGENNTSRPTGENNQTRPAGDNDPSRFTGENNPSQPGGENNLSRPAGENNPSRPAGENNPSRLTGKNYPPPPEGKKNPSRLTGENNPSRPAGENYPSLVTGKNNRSLSAGDKNPSQPVIESKKSQLMVGGKTSLHLKGENNISQSNSTQPTRDNIQSPVVQVNNPSRTQEIRIFKVDKTASDFQNKTSPEKQTSDNPILLEQPTIQVGSVKNGALLNKGRVQSVFICATVFLIFMSE